MRPSVLVVDDDSEFRSSLGGVLGEVFRMIGASTPEEAMRGLEEDPEVALVDVRLDDGNCADQRGLQVLEECKARRPQMPVVMVTAFGEVDVAVQAMKLGADDFVVKGRTSMPEYRKVIDGVLARRRLEGRVSVLEAEVERLAPREIIGRSPAILEIQRLATLAARDGRVSVLLTGETGSGKELVARLIHASGGRRDRPFVAVCIAGLNPNLVESELFGHERGAFTGAIARKEGWLLRSDGGVLFLDEIGEMSADMQVKLLRFVEERRFCRVGGSVALPVDVQLVAATNRDLEEAVRQREFRQDLFYRLKTLEVRIPPLRLRSEDIPLLCRHFLGLLRREGRTTLQRISSEALGALEAYAWPGNVRELRASIERAVIFASYHRHPVLELEDLPLEVRQPPPRTEPRGTAESRAGGMDLRQGLARAELALVQAALEQSGGRKNQALSLLGCRSRHTLVRRVRRLLARSPGLAAEFPLVSRHYGMPEGSG